MINIDVECDIRVSHVPARDWPKGASRPVFATRPPYPRYLEEEDYNIHGPDYLVGTEDSSVFKWEPMKPVFHIPQVGAVESTVASNCNLWL